MIKISISEEQRKELTKFRLLASSKDSEKALMVILSSEGRKVSEIAKTLKRNPHTVRDWLKRYIASGITGLKRKYSPGRPDDKRAKLKEHVHKILGDSPVKHGYQDNVWSVPLIKHDAALKLGLYVGNDTVTRALNALGYSYKRPTKTVPARAPSKKEKTEKIELMIKEIKSILSNSEAEVYALDESHFSTEPYLVRGWFKKRWPPRDRDEQQTREPHVFWMLKSGNTAVLLEKIKTIQQ